MTTKIRETGNYGGFTLHEAPNHNRIQRRVRTVSAASFSARESSSPKTYVEPNRYSRYQGSPISFSPHKPYYNYDPFSEIQGSPEYAGVIRENPEYMHLDDFERLLKVLESRWPKKTFSADLPIMFRAFIRSSGIPDTGLLVQVWRAKNPTLAVGALVDNLATIRLTDEDIYRFMTEVVHSGLSLELLTNLMAAFANTHSLALLRILSELQEKNTLFEIPTLVMAFLRTGRSFWLPKKMQAILKSESIQQVLWHSPREYALPLAILLVECKPLDKEDLVAALSQSPFETMHCYILRAFAHEKKQHLSDFLELSLEHDCPLATVRFVFDSKSLSVKDVEIALMASKREEVQFFILSSFIAQGKNVHPELLQISLARGCSLNIVNLIASKLQERQETLTSSQLDMLAQYGYFPKEK